MLRLSIVIVSLVIGCIAEDAPANEARDSYIDAYHDSRGSAIETNPIDRDSKSSPFYDNVSGPDQSYGPPNGYGYPEQHFPPMHYGPPVYGPPNHVPRYNTFPVPFPFYGMPHAMQGFLDKLHLKLDIFTILKIILKLVIFKKIVSFIALLCLLLFIPKFKMAKESSEEMDSRSFMTEKSQVDARLNTLTEYVLGSIEKYSGATNNTTCDGINCKVERMFRDIDNKYSYQRLLTMYAKNNDS